jgi:hypothetical protein
MAGNTYKARRNNNNSGKGSIFSWIQHIINLDNLLVDGIPLKYIPQILFVTFITIFYIGNNHYAEKTTRKIEQLESEVEELRADYTSLKANYMFSSKQSEVAKKVKDIGLKENDTPPEKILIKESEY